MSARDKRCRGCGVTAKGWVQVRRGKRKEIVTEQAKLTAERWPDGDFLTCQVCAQRLASKRHRTTEAGLGWRSSP